MNKKNGKRRVERPVVHDPVIKVTGRETHHFIVCQPDFTMRMRDDEGRILVFLARDKAQSEAVARGRRDFVTVGMGDEQWMLFQSEEPAHVIIS